MIQETQKFSDCTICWSINILRGGAFLWQREKGQDEAGKEIGPATRELEDLAD
jgi:hypothetical protein